jgi:hypothetical protein
MKSTISSDRLVTRRVLLGVNNFQWIVGQLEAGAIASPTSKADLKRVWTRSRNAYRQSTSANRSFLSDDEFQEPEGIPDADRTTLLRTAGRAWPFNVTDLELKSVPIAKLITPQLTINTERVERQSNPGENVGDSGLLSYLTFAGKGVLPVWWQLTALSPTEGSALFTSENEDIRAILPPTVRSLPQSPSDSDSPLHDTLCLQVGRGGTFAFGIKVKLGPGISRLVLLNGVHRLSNLARLGFEWVPLPICEFELGDLPPILGELATQFAFNPAANPPTVPDFWSDELGPELKFYHQLRSVRISWKMETAPLFTHRSALSSKPARAEPFQGGAGPIPPPP